MACLNWNRYFVTATTSNQNATFTGSVGYVGSFQGSISGSVLTASATGALTLGQLSISSYTYNSSTGLVTLTMGSSVSFGSGVMIWVNGLNILGVNGTAISVSASGTTVTYTTATGLSGSASGGGTLFVGGQFMVGMTVNFTVGGTPTTDTIASFGTGTGGAGTYNLSGSHTVSTQTMSTNSVLALSGLSGSINVNDYLINNGGTDASPRTLNFNTQIQSSLGGGNYVVDGGQFGNVISSNTFVAGQNAISQSMMTVGATVSVTPSASSLPGQYGFDVNNSTVAGNGYSVVNNAFPSAMQPLAFPPGATVSFEAGVGGLINIGDSIGINSATGRGVIFFPPGNYTTSQPIDFSSGQIQVIFLGSMAASTVTGNFNDYVFKQNGVINNNSVIEKLGIVNTNATGGAVRFGGNQPGTIRDCNIIANRGINDYNFDFNQPGFFGSFEFSIENCTLSPGANAAGSYAIMKQSDGQIQNCRIIGYQNGISFCGGEGAQVVLGCYFEKCTTGLAFALAPDGTLGTASGVVVAGCWFKNCATAMNFESSTALISIMGVRIEGANGQAPGGGNPLYGLVNGISSSGFLSQSMVAGMVVAGSYDVAGIYMYGRNVNIYGPVMMGVADQASSPNPFKLDPTGSALYLPSQIACNARHIYTVANLPGTVSYQDEHDVSDASSPAWGATVVGGGSSSAVVQWNGSNWTVVGI